LTFLLLQAAVEAAVQDTLVQEQVVAVVQVV
jgi:hypothetical protein